VQQKSIAVLRTIAPTVAQETAYKKAIVDHLNKQLATPSLRRLFPDRASYQEAVRAVAKDLETILSFVDDPL
jgi:hypothetical protein